jgi:A/G-specific adenine glycosylase
VNAGRFVPACRAEPQGFAAPCVAATGTGSARAVEAEIVEPLLRWYAEHGRAGLPWRRSRDPYHIVVSEFMLQQTQVERVIASYERFVAAFPGFAALAAAPRADVLRAWKGLGYNMRAVRLHDLAGAVVGEHGGVLPRDAALLRRLPGIGPYTAAAIRAFAFDLDDVAIDVNARRVVHRLRFGLEHPPRATASRIDAEARALLPRGRAHAWNSAIMDLGATICTTRAPKCGRCPLRTGCAAAVQGEAAIAQAARARLSGRRRSPQARLPFEQTRRYVRGRILDRLRDLGAGESLRPAELAGVASGAARSYPVDEILAGLERDGLVVRDSSGGMRLP